MRGPVLVTGGAGSVGRLVVARLRAQGDVVRVFDLPGLDYSGLEGEEGVEVVRGDITDAASVRHAVSGAAGVIHLAALLPPASERDEELTFAVNVEGTARVAGALRDLNPGAPLVFSSSVNTYGDTTSSEPPIAVDHPQHGLNAYARSKIGAERRLLDTLLSATILRISGISVPAFQEPPDVWPFMPEQRIEFVHRDDVVTALCAAATSEEARGRVFNIAGGVTWRMTGRAYVADYFDLLGVPIEEASFQGRPGLFDWYDTAESQSVLGYQETPYETYISQLRTAIERLMEG